MMRTFILDLDSALSSQRELASDAVRLDARDLGPALRLWSRPKAITAMRQRLRVAACDLGQILAFAGSGDFHHVSALLIDRAAEMTSRRALSVLHVDNHPDWVRFSPGMHCGSWAARVARHPGVRQVISIGMCSADMVNAEHKRADVSVVREGRLTPYPLRMPDGRACTVAGRRFSTIEELGDSGFLERVQDMIGEDDIYITIDKDALSPADAVTNWDQGELGLSRLIHWLDCLLDGRRLRGADVVGDASAPVYGPGLGSRILKSLEARLDQPSHRLLDVEAQDVNARANLALRDCLLPHLAA